MIQRSLIPQLRYRVILKTMPAEEAGAKAVRLVLLEAGLGDGEIARVLTQLPFPVATGVSEDAARRIASGLVRAGADVDVVSPPIGAPTNQPATARAARERHAQTRLGWWILGGIAAIGALAWWLSPTTQRLVLRGKPGDTISFTRSIELDQVLERQYGVTEAHGSIAYRIDRTVKSISPDEIVVGDRYRDLSFNLTPSGESAANYQADLDKTKALMAEAEVIRTYMRSGRLEGAQAEGLLSGLDPYPGFLDELLGTMSFPPYAVKVGGTWDAVLDLEHSMRFSVDPLEIRNGRKLLPTTAETVDTSNDSSPSRGFSNTHYQIDIDGRVMFDVATGWPADVNIELKRTRSSSAAGMTAMDQVHVRLLQSLVP